MNEADDVMVFRWLTVDPDLHERLKAEGKAQGRSPAHLFREYVSAGLLAERNGARLERPVPAERVRLVQVSLFVPALLDEELSERARESRMAKSDLYRALLSAGWQKQLTSRP